MAEETKKHDDEKQSELDESTDAAAEETAVVPAAQDDAEDEEDFVEDPQFEVDYKGDCAYEVKVSIPPANRSHKSAEMFDELKKEAEVPGFRPGRAPRKLIERKFGKIVKGEVDAKLVSAAFHRLIKVEELHPLGIPEIDGLEEKKERADDEPLDFTFKFEVAPRVELGDYKGIAVERPVVKVADKDVQEAVDGLRSRYAVFETLQEGEAAEGDQVIIDFKGTVDGAEFAGGSANGYPYILGTKRFFPEFEAALLGSSPGAELSCTVTLPENTPNEELRGKKADFTIVVKELKRRELPELNDDFAKQAGYESLDDMKAKIAERMQEGASEQSNRIAENRALESVINASTFELPKSLLEEMADSIYREQVSRLRHSGHPMADIEAREDELRKRAREEAEADVKASTVLNKIGDVENIVISDDDYEQEVASIARNAGVQSDAVASFLEEGDRRSRTEGRLYRAKALAIIMANAKVQDKEVKEDELKAQENANDE
ncbi:MAG TPA: trigger factor [Candidatus Hydrogenedentes bacterium]|jgi:trigger factor|nr:trigger factor [Candidatus Hydrogenedentota bacterium]HPJ98798.1 trigger factor [Candidatus Hydrogenedentota bacterium]